jgi:UDP-N-acetylenolpyruvoylglucosamine reductase
VSQPPAGVCAVIGAVLSKHMPWRVGGPCEALITVHAREAAPDALSWCRDMGWQRTYFGAGSRTVVRDGGAAGAMLRLGTGFSTWRPTDAGYRVGASTPLAVLASLPGAPAAWASLAAAPGSVGASIALDPGWEPWVRGVSFLHRGKEREDDLFALRGRGDGAWVLEVHLGLAPVGELTRPGPVTPTSWYLPPKEDDAGALMRQVSLAGTRLRQVAIPEAEPQMLVNLGGGTARDLALLQKSAIERLHREAGVLLEERMSWLGRVT